MRLSLFLTLLSFALPLPASASSGLPRWTDIVRDAEWIAAGTVTRTDEKGFLVVMTEALAGTPPYEQFVPHWVPRLLPTTPVIVYGSAERAIGCRFQEFEIASVPKSRWQEEASFTARTMVSSAWTGT